MDQPSLVLTLVKEAIPGSFIDARLSVRPESAIIYRARQPIIGNISEVPMLQDFGICPVSAIMAGRTQVGVCIRFRERDNIVAKITHGNFATFSRNRIGGEDLSEPYVAMRTPDFLIFSYKSRKALIVKKLNKGRGYSNQ